MKKVLVLSVLTLGVALLAVRCSRGGNQKDKALGATPVCVEIRHHFCRLLCVTTFFVISQCH